MVNPVPDTPSISSSKVATITRKTKPATPDLIIFQEKLSDPTQLSQLIFEKIGGIELLTISRNDIINGQQISYNLVSNTSQIEQAYGSTKLVNTPGSINEQFENFAIKFVDKVPSEGTGPFLYYVGELNSVPSCAGYPILNRYTDEYIACVTVVPGQGAAALKSAQDLAESLSPARNVVYSDAETGDIVVDVVNLEINDRIEIEILQVGDLEDDTIY